MGQRFPQQPKSNMSNIILLCKFKFPKRCKVRNVQYLDTTFHYSNKDPKLDADTTLNQFQDK